MGYSTQTLVETIYRYSTLQLELNEALEILNMTEKKFLYLCKERGDIVCHYYEGEYEI